MGKIWEFIKKEWQANQDGYAKMEAEENAAKQHPIVPFPEEQKYQIPPNKTERQYANELLKKANWHANEINSSTCVFDFTCAYKKLLEIFEKLIWLNEVRNIFMYPTPRSNLEEIQSHIVETINKVIRQSLRKIESDGVSVEEEIKNFTQSFMEDETIQSIAKAENYETMNQLIIDIKNAEKARCLAEEKRRLSTIGHVPNLNFSKFDSMDVIRAMEAQLDSIYLFFLNSALSVESGNKLFSDFKENCLSSKLPLAAEVRLESLLEEYEKKFSYPSPLVSIDHMDGHQFEKWCAKLLERNGFTNVTVTRGSGDQGVDITAVKDEVHYAIQCKCYSSNLGNTPVQQVHAGKSLYRCQVGVVMTNQYFTPGAIELAQATGVLLWDRDKLKKMIGSAAP